MVAADYKSCLVPLPLLEVLVGLNRKDVHARNHISVEGYLTLLHDSEGAPHQEILDLILNLLLHHCRFGVRIIQSKECGHQRIRRVRERMETFDNPECVRMRCNRWNDILLHLTYVEQAARAYLCVPYVDKFLARIRTVDVLPADTLVDAVADMILPPD